MRDPRGGWLFTLTLFDGLVRLALGAFLFASPGMLAGALAGAIVFTVIVVMSTLGLAGMIVGLIGQPVPTGGGAVRRARGWPVFIAGLCTLLFGVALVVGPPGADNSREILCAYAFAFGLALLYEGARLPRLRSQLSERASSRCQACDLHRSHIRRRPLRCHHYKVGNK